jgi:hypothetical protein
MPQTVLLDPNAVRVLKTSASRIWWLLFGSVILLAAGVVVLALGEHVVWGWFFFAAGAFLFIRELVWPDRLTLTRDGFSFTILGPRTRIAWSDVAEFGVLRTYRVGTTTRQVGINLKRPRSGVVRALVSGYPQFDYALPETYGLPVEDLTAIMEEWRAAASTR